MKAMTAGGNWARMAGMPKTGLRIRFSHDKVTEAHVVGGAVLNERDITANYEKRDGWWVGQGELEPEK